MNITCCYKCEKRYPRCHNKCEDYIKQKEMHNAEVEKARAIKEKQRVIRIGDFSYSAYRKYK